MENERLSSAKSAVGTKENSYASAGLLTLKIGDESRRKPTNDPRLRNQS
jgi:hypothetical protein